MLVEGKKLIIPRDAIYPTLGGLIDFDVHAEAYYKAAKSLWGSVPKMAEGRAPRPDSLVFPILFLLHHFFELELKEVIRATHSIGSMKGIAELKKTPTKTHDLKKLLSDADFNLARLGLLDGSPPFSEESRRIIEDIDDFGRKGEILRYPFDKKLKPIVPSLFIADMQAVMKKVEKAWEEFGGVIGCIADMENFEI